MDAERLERQWAKKRRHALQTLTQHRVLLAGLFRACDTHNAGCLHQGTLARLLGSRKLNLGLELDERERDRGQLYRRLAAEVIQNANSDDGSAVGGVVDFNQLMQYVSTATLNLSPPPPSYAEDPQVVEQQRQQRQHRQDRGGAIPGSVEHEVGKGSPPFTNRSHPPHPPFTFPSNLPSSPTPPLQNMTYDESMSVMSAAGAPSVSASTQSGSAFTPASGSIAGFRRGPKASAEVLQQSVVEKLRNTKLDLSQPDTSLQSLTVVLRHAFRKQAGQGSEETLGDGDVFCRTTGAKRARFGNGRVLLWAGVVSAHFSPPLTQPMSHK